MATDTMFNWQKDGTAICRAISENFRPLKILLKTKDDAEMLEPWLSHHKKIAGPEGLIVFDNMSTTTDVQAICRSNSDKIQIYSYSGFHNTIHHTGYFGDLYNALRRSCDRFLFLDTDEHLALYDGDSKFVWDSSIIDFLAASNDKGIIPATWLQNVTGFKDKFSLYDRQLPLEHGLGWGKPIIFSKSGFEGVINHNTQLNHRLFSQKLITNFFVLHLSRVSKSQRIEANLRKLRAYGIIPEAAGINEVLNMALQDLPAGNPRMYATEVHDLARSNDPSFGSLSGSIDVSEGGTITFTAEWQREALQNFIASPDHYTSKLFAPN